MKCMWCGKDDTTGEKISGMCEDCKTKQSETLPDKLARLIRENTGMPVRGEVGILQYDITQVQIEDGAIVITIGTP
jgi:hypothetical protein